MLNGRIVKRSWGYYITLIDRDKFKVKLLRFKEVKAKDMQMSMQRHVCRNELWLFLSGSGWFHNDPLTTDFSKEYELVHAGDYRDVQSSFWHTFFPFGKATVLEIQYGEKCDEGDIIRV